MRLLLMWNRKRQPRMRVLRHTSTIHPSIHPSIHASNRGTHSWANDWFSSFSCVSVYIYKHCSLYDLTPPINNCSARRAIVTPTQSRTGVTTHIRSTDTHMLFGSKHIVVFASRQSITFGVCVLRYAMNMNGYCDISRHKHIKKQFNIICNSRLIHGQWTVALNIWFRIISQWILILVFSSAECETPRKAQENSFPLFVSLRKCVFFLSLSNQKMKIH